MKVNEVKVQYSKKIIGKVSNSQTATDYCILTKAPLYNLPSAETMYCSLADNPDKTSTWFPNDFPVLIHLKMAVFPPAMV